MAIHGARPAALWLAAPLLHCRCDLRRRAARLHPEVGELGAPWPGTRSSTTCGANP